MILLFDIAGVLTHFSDLQAPLNQVGKVLPLQPRQAQEFSISLGPRQFAALRY